MIKTNLFLPLALILMLASSYANAGLINSGSETIPASFTFDLETGTLDSSPSRDIWWQIVDDTTRLISPAQFSSTMLSALGAADYASISFQDLVGYTYSTSSIVGPTDLTSPSGDLSVNNVFAVKTTEGNYAKVKVTGYDSQINAISIDFDVYGVPEPGLPVLLLTGLMGLFIGRRRRKPLSES